MHTLKIETNTLYLKQDHPGALDLRFNGLVLEFHSSNIDSKHRIPKQNHHWPSDFRSDGLDLKVHGDTKNKCIQEPKHVYKQEIRAKTLIIYEKPLSKHDTNMKEEREALFSLLERSTATGRRGAVGGAPTWWSAVAPPRQSNFSSFFEIFYGIRLLFFFSSRIKTQFLPKIKHKV